MMYYIENYYNVYCHSIFKNWSKDNMYIDGQMVDYVLSKCALINLNNFYIHSQENKIKSYHASEVLRYPQVPKSADTEDLQQFDST